MKNLSKIAFLVESKEDLSFSVKEAKDNLLHAGIEVAIFCDSESILDYQPDCVIVTTPQHAKLTPYPTYGLLNMHKGEYLELPRFFRNLLTYDGYLTSSAHLKQMICDVMFGARKLQSNVLKFDFYANDTSYQIPSVNKGQLRIILFEPNYQQSLYKQAISTLLKQMHNVFVLTFYPPEQHEHKNRFITAKNADDATKIMHQNGIVVCLDAGLTEDETISPALIKAISSSAIVISQHSSYIESHFADSLFYIPANTSANSLNKIISFHLTQIQKNLDAALEKSKRAHQIYLNEFAFTKLLNDFIKFHEQTLINKGYLPHPDPEVESKLPSVTYIIRTGGKHRAFLERTLDCLVAQQYPDLRVLFVIHANFPYIEEIKAQYASLKIKVIESIKSKRSEAIRDGMAAIETDLFGLFDDDDEIFPNHVRTLVKIYQYHNKRDWRGEIGMVYSGSIHADDTYSVLERGEFRDHKWVNKNEKRAIEHFRFYSSRLMSQHAWFMPNGWLARASLIDEELLNDPGLDTCEDLYFELQIAQRAHFAFSVEVTAIHHFHHFGNSTIDDSHKHIPDTQRIALRNFTRVFPEDSQYDLEFNLIGKPYGYDRNIIAYQDLKKHETVTSWFSNPYFPFRLAKIQPQSTQIVYQAKNLAIKRIIKLGLKVFVYAKKFYSLDASRKKMYFSKFKSHLYRYGWLATLNKSITFLSNNYIETNMQDKQKQTKNKMGITKFLMSFSKICFFPLKLFKAKQ